MTKTKGKKPQTTTKAFHPNSRKATQLSRKAQRLLKVKNIKRRKESRTSALVSKLMWFRNVLDETKSCYTREEVEEMIELYLHRLDDDLDTITEKQENSCLSSHYRLQHASKEDSLRSVIVQERQLFETSGIEIPDLMNGQVYKTFLEWSGETNKISNLKMRKFNRTR